MHKKWKPFFWFFVLLLPVLAFAQNGGTGNPLFRGWYADPEAVVIKKDFGSFLLSQQSIKSRFSLMPSPQKTELPGKSTAAF